MYKWNAGDYHKRSSEQQKWAKELIGKLKLKGNEKILDIGCGDGKVTAEIAQCLPKGFVLGIDNSEEMIRFAKENFPPDKFANLAFKKIDVRDLSQHRKVYNVSPKPPPDLLGKSKRLGLRKSPITGDNKSSPKAIFLFDNEFDIIFSNACLHWVIEHLPVLRGIKKSLKPNGKILIQMGGKGNAAKIIEVLEEMLKDEKWSRFFNDFPFPYGFYGAEEYKRWLNEAGLKAIRVELIPKNMVHKGKEGLFGWIKTTWLPYTHRLPEVLREGFINELADKYIEQYPLDKDGFAHIQMMRLEVEAGKLT